MQLKHITALILCLSLVFFVLSSPVHASSSHGGSGGSHEVEETDPGHGGSGGQHATFELKEVMEPVVALWNWCRNTDIGVFGYHFTFTEFWLYCILASILVWFIAYWLYN